MAEISDREALIASAERMGLPPVHWGGLMSYESGLNPNRWGGAGGRHVGLIQFGPAEQKAFGVTGNETFQEQLPKAEAFMLSRGYQPGMGLMQAYSTVNAGSPGRLNASDAKNGGMPGTVADKVNNQFGPHFKRAAAFLGGDFTPTMPAGTNDAAPSAPFGFHPPPAGGDTAAPQTPAAAPDDTADIAAILRTLMPRQQEQPAAAPQEAPAAAPMPMPEPMAAPQFDAAKAFALLPATARRRA
ncbi:hypothetical protein [Methylobacterium aquaticum]|uniref:hypothetical protein n=1 Tax=Methylobacterium aquaticum TaxID=270351 RepID=UPI001931615C|nr:hypothetical protein [Methylobacterium aquaticum]QRE76479.1 hypothetical protein F1D61_25520 [Methylobacterium aquaticum]